MLEKYQVEAVRKVINSDTFVKNVSFEELNKISSITRTVVKRSVERIWEDVRSRIDVTTKAKAEKDGITYEQALSEITQQLMEGKQ